MPNPLVRSVKAVCLREFRLSWKHWSPVHPGVASACQSSDANSISKQGVTVVGRCHHESWARSRQRMEVSIVRAIHRSMPRVDQRTGDGR